MKHAIQEFQKNCNPNDPTGNLFLEKAKGWDRLEFILTIFFKPFP